VVCFWVLVAISAHLVAGTATMGCSCDTAPVEPPPSQSPRETVLPDEGEPPEHVVVPAAVALDPSRSIEPASRSDDHVSPTPVRVRRLVYRFFPRLPWGLGPGRPDLLPPTGELRIDISGPRLRARFVGNGFPVDEGAEVRLRSDLPGTYVFDGLGGRPYGTGQLAAWFQAGPGASGVELTVRESSPDDPIVVDMVCRLFGEWAGASIAAVRRSCASDGMPMKMMFGLYRVDRTAEATIEIPERAMRADHVDPPHGLSHLVSFAFHEPSVLARFVPDDDPPEQYVPRGTVPVVVTEGLRVENHTGARVMVTVDGVAVGWLDSGSEPLVLTGLRPGGYMVGGVMPLGGRACRTRMYEAPSNVVLERPREVR
jgi:hypothetical protein